MQVLPTPRRWMRRVLLFGALAYAPVALAQASVPSRSLHDSLEELKSDRLFRTSKVALQVVSVDTGEEVFSSEPDRALNPASTMKVLTAAAALRTLGPSYRFETELWTDGDIDSSGVLRGNLYVRGTGDPTMVIEKLWKLVYDLKLEGVEQIAGDVIYDESFFADDYMLPGWDKKEDLERGPSYFPTLSALSLNFNTVALVVGPGADVGSDARIRLETPADSYVTVVNDVITGSSSTWRWLEIEREVTDPTLTFTVSGSVPVGSDTRKYYRSVAEPTSHFAAAFQQMLASHDISVSGRHRRATTPGDVDLLVSVSSPPLAVILMDMNKFSNNFMAEQVLRMLGAEVHGVPGNTEKGLRVVRDYLVSLGIPERNFVLVNGSGLTRDAFITPRQLTTVLVDMAHDPHVGHEFVGSLAIGGMDGTLRSRFEDEPGRLRGKTGTIDGIHCLTGYVESEDGQLYAFAFLVNDIRGSIRKVKDLHDRFAEEMFKSTTEGTEVVDGD